MVDKTQLYQMYGTIIEHLKPYENGRVIWFSNLKGETRNGIYNQSGSKSIGVYLYPEDAERLSRLGWNVKERIMSDDEEPRPFIDIKFKWKTIEGLPVKKAPRVYKVPKGKKPIPLDELTIGEIDDIAASVIDGHFKINPSYKNGHVVAYAELGYFVVDETTPSANRDELETDPFVSWYE